MHASEQTTHLQLVEVPERTLQRERRARRAEEAVSGDTIDKGKKRGRIKEGCQIKEGNVYLRCKLVDGHGEWGTMVLQKYEDNIRSSGNTAEQNRRRSEGVERNCSSLSHNWPL
jgi:hypothetical protein